jgi:hypothetical protein
LADKIGLDGIAFCTNEDDYTLDKELNFELVTKPEAPWYDQLREKQLVNLFNEQKPTR